MADTQKLSLLTASPRELAIRRAKVGLFQARRLLSWAALPDAWRRPSMAASTRDFPHCIYEHVSPLGRSDQGADPVLEAGKRVNVALAAPHFDGLVLGRAQPLSFWRVLGRATAARGFCLGMELRGGCIVPTLGGGLCRLSNALFRMACELGWTIIERHGHTMEAVPPLPGDLLWGLDATVFWPHVDLRVAPVSGPVRLGMQVLGDELILRVHAQGPSGVAVELESTEDRIAMQGSERVRTNRIIRRVLDRPTGALVAEDIVADNRKRLLHTEEQRKNCLTCNESGCHARPRELVAMARRA